MRLIDADTIPWDCLSIGGAITSLNVVNKLPTIDAVPVIRCLACTRRSDSGLCYKHGHMVADDFFCAHGTTEIIKKAVPAKKAEKKTEERCMATGLACSRCVPGPCDHRRLEIK